MTTPSPTVFESTIVLATAATLTAIFAPMTTRLYRSRS
jgi:hypothetical protein